MAQNVKKKPNNKKPHNNNHKHSNQGKGKAEDVIRMDFLHLSTAVIHSNVSLLYLVAVVYGYKHILMMF